MSTPTAEELAKIKQDMVTALTIAKAAWEETRMPMITCNIEDQGKVSLAYLAGKIFDKL